MPYTAVLSIAAVCLACYFVVVADASLRAKAGVVVALLFAFFTPAFVPARHLVGLGLQFAVSIGLLLYFKLRPDQYP